MEQTITRYIGRRAGVNVKLFRELLEEARRKSFDYPTCLGEKKVEITISVKEVE